MLNATCINCFISSQKLLAVQPCKLINEGQGKTTEINCIYMRDRVKLLGENNKFVNKI